jgi:hypothetical protein
VTERTFATTNGKDPFFALFSFSSTLSIFAALLSLSNRHRIDRPIIDEKLAPFS